MHFYHFLKKIQKVSPFLAMLLNFFQSLRVPGCHPFSTLVQTISLISFAQKIKKYNVTSCLKNPKIGPRANAKILRIFSKTIVFLKITYRTC